MLKDLRNNYHKALCSKIIRIRKSKNFYYPNFADVSSDTSKNVAWKIVEAFDCDLNYEKLVGQTAGTLFEIETRQYIKEAFNAINHLRPGDWNYRVNSVISLYDQYKHLEHLEQIIKDNRTLASTLGSGYIVQPDIVVTRKPIEDNEINKRKIVIKKTDNIASLTPLRNINNEGIELLHASISCKFTIRSDRSQNTRTEALNLIRNRKGKLPHIVAVTGEPLPTRISTLALGTGDLDCVYHIALYELKQALKELDNEDQLDMINMMIDSRRLRDISDLPFDLAI
ncbi:MAG: NgoMIV family type II restriction endonuclease [Bacteroidales bacterium]